MGPRRRVLCAFLLASASAFAADPAPPPKAAAPAVREPGFDEQFQAAQALAHSGKRQAALAAYDALLKRSPGNADVLLGRGQLYAWMGRWKESETDLRAVTRSSPNYADAWAALGNLYRWSDRPKDAAAAYAHWSLLAPQDPAPHFARGGALRSTGNISAARLEFEAARALGAPESEVETALGTLRTGALAPDVAAAPGGYRWTAALAGDRTWLSGGRQDQASFDVSLRRQFERGSLALELLDAQRFGLQDRAWALDAYAGLWSRAYTNLRYQQNPNGSLFPGNAERIEIWQGVGHGWEFSASDDRLNFATRTEIYGLAVGRYTGDWYARLRVTQVDGGGSPGWRLTLRDYYAGDADDYLEFSGGTGRTDVVTGGATVRRSSGSVGLAWVKFFAPHWGIKLGAGYSDEADHTEDTLSAALYTRW